MSGHPIEMMLSDLSSSVKRIRCAAALLLVTLCDGHHANQRLLRRQPGFTVTLPVRNNESSWMSKSKNVPLQCRVFWTPLQLRGKYIADVTRQNQAVEEWNVEVIKGKCLKAFF